MDVELIVNTLAQHGLIRPHKVSGDWYQCYCPFHNDGNERKPSFGILVRSQYKGGQKYPEGFAHCFTCGWAKGLPETVSEILKRKSIGQSGVQWLEANIPGFVSDTEFEDLIPNNVMSAVQNKFALDYIAEQESRKVTYVSEEELATYRYTVPYMYERGLNDKLIEDYDIGVDMNWVPPGRHKVVPCITFPVRDREKRTLFLCRRSIQGKLFNYPEHVVKPVYGIEMVPKGCKSVVICESCLDALVAVKYGYPAVALLGTSNSYQIQQLRELGASEYVIATDGDEGGRKAAAKLKRALSSVALIWTIPMPDGKDVNDCDEATFNELYLKRE